VETRGKKLSIAALCLVGAVLVAASVVARLSSAGVGPHGRAADLYLRIIHEKGSDRPAAEKGLQVLGADAMPTITNYLGYRDTWFRSQMRDLLSRQSLVKFPIYNRFDYLELAGTGIRLIGTNAGPALVGMFHNAPVTYVGEEHRAYLATRNLIRLGPPAIPALVAGLTNENDSIRVLSAMTITASSEVRHHSAVPNLVRCAGDTNAHVRAAAVFALGRVLERPKLSVPALAKSLSDTNSAVRFQSIHSLWAFGMHSQSAIPAIEKAITAESAHPDAGFDQWELGPKSRAMIMDALTNALETIRYHIETPN
jgi:hypothetical protein